MVPERETHFWIPNGVLAFAYLAPLWLTMDTNGYTLKLFSIIGHTLLLVIQPDVCCLDGLVEYYWYTAIIGINIISLYHSYRETVLPIIPRHLQPIVSKLFYEFPISHKELGSVLLYSKFTGIGEDEVWIKQDTSFPNSCLNILITGHLGVFYQGALLHEIKPGQFINSIEWKATFVNELKGYWLSQVEVRVIEDSTILMLDRGNLMGMKETAHHIWRRLLALLGADILMKTKHTHWYVKDFAKKDRRHRVANNPLLRSLSVDNLFVSSQNAIQGSRALRQMISKRSSRRPLGSLKQRFNQTMLKKNLGLMYLWSKSELRPTTETGPLSSLFHQTAMTPENQIFEDEGVVEDIGWERAWYHCGHCEFCYPLEEKEEEIHHATGRH
ncbi:uncharacterized protein LOC131885391 [Tigriopus californicus]|nr:uncharacterized protein LOC131885391 [Tigriopus californicus]